MQPPRGRRTVLVAVLVVRVRVVVGVRVVVRVAAGAGGCGRLWSGPGGPALRPRGTLDRQAAGVLRVVRPGAAPVLGDAGGGAGARPVGGDGSGALGPQLRGVRRAVAGASRRKRPSGPSP